MSETYISVDIEADGPIPGDYSMLAIGAAAFDRGELIDTFTVNLRRLEGAGQHPDTMEWWARNPEALAKVNNNPMNPEAAMQAFSGWLTKVERPVFVGYPASFDFMFVHWYMVHFLGRDPFGFQALDLKTYAMAVLGTEFKETTKRNMPKEWFGKEKHTHVAVEDALGQGVLFGNMRKYRDRHYGNI